MAQDFIKSTPLTNRDARPQIPNPLTYAGRNFMKRAVCTATAGVLTGSQYGFFSLPSSAVIVSAELSTVAQGGSSAADIGLWETAAKPGNFVAATGWANQAHATADSYGGAVTNAGQYFVAGQTLVSALTKTQLWLLNSSFQTRALADQPIWKVMGLTSDPQVEYDVVMTATATITTGGAMVMEVSYKLQ